MRIVQQVKVKADRVLPSDFSFFHNMPTDENALSDYLALLFDPRGSHGQQALFQALFLQYLQTQGVKVAPTQYDIYREYSANGRIDILLTSHDAAIIIENKPYAGDQPDQLTNTVRHKICSPRISCYDHGFPGSTHLPAKRSRSLGPSKLSKESRLWKPNLLVCLTKLLHLSCP
jgi:hypothetical protein